MLLTVKIAEIQNHLEYLLQTFTRLQTDTHSNLAERLRQLSATQLTEWKAEAKQLANRINRYEKARTPALDTWKQIYSELTELAASVQHCRIIETPAYLSVCSDDYYVSNLLQAIHKEIGLGNLKPVASLYQNSWFSTSKELPTYPLYFLPPSLKSDPSELPLLFHEIGHIIFALWGDELIAILEAVINADLFRKLQAINAESDPDLRTTRSRDLASLRLQVGDEIEELICDIIGTLIGGDSFTISFALGLFCTSLDNPFDRQSETYPPLDCRMRVGRIVTENMGLKTDIVNYLDESWSRVTSSYVPQPWYKWFYDDQYISDLANATKLFLVSKGISLYAENCGGIRQELANGLITMLNDASGYQRWITVQNERFLTNYSSSS